jgi:Amt family ammonium transporter
MFFERECLNMTESKRIGWALILGVLVVLSIVFGFEPKAFETVSPHAEPWNPADTAWLLGASGLVLLMTPGLALFYGGMVNARNIISTMFQGLISIGVVSVAWILVGFSVAFGDSQGGLYGNPFQYFLFNGVGAARHSSLGGTLPFALFALFQLKFAIITPALITGALAERIRFSAYLLFMALWSVLVYAPLAHWTWHPDGIFWKMGLLDFAGGTVVHISAGMAAVAGALVLGKRSFKKEGHADEPANIPLIILGTGLLWFGWFGFNAGSSLAANDVAVLAFLNTNTASSVAMLTWLALDGLRGKKPSATNACIAAVVGLVAITPAAGYVPVAASMVIGMVGAIVSNIALSYKHLLKLDDALDVFACHGLGGITGMILTSVFATSKVNSAIVDQGLTSGDSKLFMNHLLGLCIAVAFSFVGSFVLLKITNIFVPLRVTTDEEKQGLDLSQHGEQYHSSQGIVEQVGQ